MRNLKKILALALALVMSMSLMATANAFTDDEKITDTYETAVNVLSGLKVFQGYDEGDFRPQGAITRAEVAAIIYRIVTGDVNDTQVGIYADYGLFDDVASTSWYAGYVNFCANAEYIKGYDADTFGPNDPITGYQALAMILRALGYDKNGEFTGTSWHIQTAAVGEQRKITKNITAGTLQSPATREVVAEILFRAILVETVNYTPAFGYQIGDTSLGEKTFGLEEIVGVVTANEYADLNDDHPQKAGKTVLDVDGEDYTIDYATTLEDIGESRSAYITGSTVLAIGDSGLNTVFETGAEADISSSGKFEDVTGLERTGAEHFYNFDGNNTYKASDYRIKYVLIAEDAAAAALYEEEYGINMKGSLNYEKTINPEKAISDTDMAIMKDIFYDADLEDGAVETIVVGEVYVGTQSKKDISDEISWKAFVDEYIVTGENSTEVVGNENGNWLKVIDNNGDGVAEYVLKTIYTAAGVEDINRDGDIELTPLYDTLDKTDSLNQLDKDTAVKTADELNEGDVVYYAVIDGNAQTYLAEMVTAEIDKVNRNTLTATTTDGDEYLQSDVHNHVGWAGFEDGVRNLEGKVSYDLYLDKYDNLMVFTETAYTGDFALLTDGYFESSRTEDIYAAMVWNGEELVDTDITSGGDLFIYDNRDDNDWDNLKDFVGINDDGGAMTTIVAALSEDGDLVPVEDSTNTRDIRIVATDDNVIPGRDYQDGTVYITDDDTAYDLAVRGNAEIRALSTTVYYYVYEDGGDTIVEEYVGYANLPDLYADDKALIEDVYAVGTLSSRESGLGSTEYYTANVVVVEFSRSYRANAEQVFIVDTPVVSNSVKREDVEVIRADGTSDVVTLNLTKSVGATYDPAGEKRIQPGLYYMWETTEDGVYVVERMSAEDIADSRYAVGQVSTSLDTLDYDWVEVRLWNVRGETGEFDTFGYNADSSKTYTLDYSVERYNWNDVWYLDADLAEADADEVLDEQVDISREQDAAQAIFDGRYWWNNNDVLISYNGDGDIIYAVSFNNYDTYTAAEMAYLNLHQNVDYAQEVWGSLMSAVPSVPTVVFYGKTATVDSAGETITATVPYGETVGQEPFSITKGKVVKVTDPLADPVTAAGDVYEGIILGDDGNYYDFTLTVTAQSTVVGTLKTANEALVHVITADDGTQTWKVADEDTLTLKSFAALLSATNGCTVRITAKDSNGRDIATENFDNFVVANAATLTVEIVNEDGYAETIAEETDAVWKVTLNNGVKAYTDSTRNNELVGSYVESGTTLYFEVDGVGTLSGASIADSASANGKTTASSAITGNSTISFTAQTQAEANTAIIKAAMDTLDNLTDALEISGTDSTEAAVKALVKAAVEEVIGNEDIEVEVTSIGSLNGATQNQTKPATDVAITLTLGADADEATDSKTDLEVDFTYLYDDAALVADINAAIQNTYTVAGSNYEAFKTSVETAIATVDDVTTGEAVEVAAISYELSTGKFEVGGIATVSYTVTYAGNSVSGSIDVTLA